jgi:hypothetical protein
MAAESDEPIEQIDEPEHEMSLLAYLWNHLRDQLQHPVELPGMHKEVDRAPFVCRFVVLW